MEGLNPNSWYRIPGYNGYEYHINAREVRSWKNISKYPNGYILSKKDGGTEGFVWELTSDYNKRERVTEKMIADIFKSATHLSDGTNSKNYGARRHLMRHPGTHQTHKHIDNTGDNRFEADFSYFMKK